MLLFGWILDLGHFIWFDIIFPNSFRVQGERNKTFNAWYFTFNITWLCFRLAGIVFVYINIKVPFWMKIFNVSQVWKTIECLNIRTMWTSETCFARKRWKFELHDENLTKGPKNLFDLREFSIYRSSN